MEIRKWLQFRSKRGLAPSHSSDIEPRPLHKSPPAGPRTVQLHETTQRLSALAAHSPLAVIEWDSSQRITKWMGNAEALFGWRSHEVLGKRLDEFRFIHPADMKAVRSALDALTRGQNSVVRNRNFRKDGSSIYCEWYNSAMIEPPGRLIWGLSLALDITDRHHMEEALRANEQRLASIYNTVGDALFHLAVESDGQFRFLSVNAAFLRVTGLAAESIIGKTVHEVIPEPSLSIALQKYRRVVQEKTIVRWEETSGYPGGQLTGEVSVAPVLDEGGACTHLVGSVHDISERKQAQEALRASEEKYRNIFEAAPVGIFQARPGCGLISANSRLAAMFEYDSPEELLRFTNQHSGELYVYEHQHAEVLRRIRESTGYVQSEVTYRHKDGSPFVCDLHMRAVDPDDPNSIMEGFVADITERKRAEEALHTAHEDLRASEERFRSLFEAAPVGIFQSTFSGRFLSANSRLASMFGYSSPEELIRSVNDITAQNYVDSDQRRDILKRVRESRGYVQSEVTYRRRDGTQFICNLYMRAVNPDDPDPVLEGFNEDVTERKRAEEALREAHLILERRVAERTAELSAANERLQELDRLKSQFLASMSHELRTPLNSIIGFTSILRRGMSGPLTEEQAKQLGIVQTSAAHLLGLINDLLDVSRIEAGKADLECEAFDFLDVVGEVVRTMQPMAERKALKIAVCVHDSAIPVLGDRKRSVQILLNLVSNAVKFTSHGEITICAATSPTTLRVDVADTGIGIKSEHIGMLFEAFRQLDGSAKRIYEGTGLGLYLCRKLLTIMGGEISVQSEYGKGSRFTYSHPLALSNGVRG